MWQKMERHSINYDYFHRPRRQEFDGYCVENGAFYITSKERLCETGNRISGKVKAVEMSEDTFFEIDEPSDWQIIEKAGTAFTCGTGKNRSGRKKNQLRCF